MFDKYYKPETDTLEEVYKNIPTVKENFGKLFLIDRWETVQYTREDFCIDALSKNRWSSTLFTRGYEKYFS
jgi:hypothetical protein